MPAYMSPEQLQADLTTMRSVLEGASADKGPHRMIIAAGNFFTAAVILLAVPFIMLIFSIPLFTEPEKKEALVAPVVGGGVILILLVLSLPFLVAGWGLMKKRQWGEAAAVVAACFNILSFPLGTALAVYTFWAMSQGKLKPGPSA